MTRSAGCARIARRTATAGAGLCAVLCALASAASALTPAPGWQLTSRSYPTQLSPGGKALLRIDVYNVGAAPSRGPVTVTDTLPPGLTATAAGNYLNGHVEAARWRCKGATVVTCTNDSGELPEIAPGQSENKGQESIADAADVAPGAVASEQNHVSVSGGGAADPGTDITGAHDQYGTSSI